MKIIKEYISRAAPYTFDFLNRIRRYVARDNDNSFKIGFIVDEFFHKDLRGFGGYGMLVRNLSQRFNTTSEGIDAEVFLASMLKDRENSVSRYHDTNVYFRAGHTRKYVANFLKYGYMVNQSNVDLLISVDWYQSYEYVADSMPAVPLLVWIQDPRSKKEWNNISTVPMEAKVIGHEYEKIDVEKIFKRKQDSFLKLSDKAKKDGRKIIFATQARFLVERARKAYGVPDLEAEFLPNVIDIPDLKEANYSKRPSLCLLGRLDPVKRPWIYFELAKRFPEVDFYVAGKAHNQELMNPIIEKYENVSNLKFLGHVDGKEKRDLLNKVWALVNTSIHEALPVTFLESFAYGKPVISCQNPDNLVSDYGYWAGEVLGDGMKEEQLNKFTECIHELLQDDRNRIQKGQSGYEYVRKNHNIDNFKKTIKQFIGEII